MEPQPLSITANGGKIIESMTRNTLILGFYILVFII
jgi:hypothetical protein